jgi:hypothetical protein
MIPNTTPTPVAATKNHTATVTASFWEWSESLSLVGMATSVVTTLLVRESVEVVNTEDTLSAGVVVVATTQEILAVCVGRDIFNLEEAPGAAVDWLGSGVIVPSITFSVADMTYGEMDHISKNIPSRDGWDIRNDSRVAV